MTRISNQRDKAFIAISMLNCIICCASGGSALVIETPPAVKLRHHQYEHQSNPDYFYGGDHAEDTDRTGQGAGVSTM